MNIHGETTHTGKRPERLEAGTQKRTELIRLRREMKEAIQGENYERASQLRDEIRRIEESASWHQAHGRGASESPRSCINW